MYDGQSVCQLQRCHNLYRLFFSCGGLFFSFSKKMGVMANSAFFNFHFEILRIGVHSQHQKEEVLGEGIINHIKREGGGEFVWEDGDSRSRGVMEGN